MLALLRSTYRRCQKFDAVASNINISLSVYTKEHDGNMLSLLTQFVHHANLYGKGMECGNTK